MSKSYVVSTTGGYTATFPIYSIEQAKELINASAMYTDAHAEAHINGFALDYENNLRHIDAEHVVHPSGMQAGALPSVLCDANHADVIALLEEDAEVAVDAALTVDNNLVFVEVFDNPTSDTPVTFTFAMEDVKTAYGHLLWDERTILLDENRGMYIPQAFITRYEGWEGISDGDRGILREGPDHPEYMEAWDDVLENATWTDKRGIQFRLEQDGDLWVVPVDAINPNESE